MSDAPRARPLHSQRGLASVVLPAGLAVACLVLAVVTAACSTTRSSAVRSFDPQQPGVLTVATAEKDAPGFWERDTAGRLGGFEAGIAQELSERLDLERVEVVEVPFADLVRGRLGGADVAISQITPTGPRDGVLDFTAPYLAAAPGVLVGAEVSAEDLQGLRELRWVVMESSLLATVVTDQIRPLTSPRVVSTRAAALATIADGKAEAMLLDLPVARALAAAQPEDLRVVGQLTGREGLAVALPDRSTNLDPVDAALRSMLADGTVTDLAETWLGGDGSDVPLIRTKR